MSDTLLQFTKYADNTAFARYYVGMVADSKSMDFADAVRQVSADRGRLGARFEKMVIETLGVLEKTCADIPFFAFASTRIAFNGVVLAEFVGPSESIVKRDTSITVDYTHLDRVRNHDETDNRYPLYGVIIAIALSALSNIWLVWRFS